MAKKPNYEFEKRRKEMERKAKKEERKQRKLDNAGAEGGDASEPFPDDAPDASTSE